MPQFDVSTFISQLFWLTLVFGFLLIVVTKFIAPKAESIITSRNRYLEDNINASEEYNHKSHSLKLSKQEKLDELNSDAEAIRKNAISAMEAYFTTRKAELNRSLDKKIKESMKEIEGYADSFHLSEPKHCIDLAAFIVEKITGKPADLKLLEQIHGVK